MENFTIGRPTRAVPAQKQVGVWRLRIYDLSAQCINGADVIGDVVLDKMAVRHAVTCVQARRRLSPLSISAQAQRGPKESATLRALMKPMSRPVREATAPGPAQLCRGSPAFSECANALGQPVRSGLPKKIVHRARIPRVALSFRQTCLSPACYQRCSGLLWTVEYMEV